MPTRPIVIYSYNRPKYFLQSLISLKEQVKDEDIYLFQDGPRLETSDSSLISENIDIFSNLFPSSKIFTAKANFGYAQNIKRGMDFIFQKYESAIFLQDDIVLGSKYLENLNSMMDYFASINKIGLMNCVGGINPSFDICSLFPYLTKYDDYDKFEQRNSGKPIPMHYLMAYGLTKKVYDNIKNYLAPYFGLLNCDYKNRNHQSMVEYYAQYGLNPLKFNGNFDIILFIVLFIKGYINISTVASNAIHIGEIGEHSNTNTHQIWNIVKLSDLSINNWLWNNDIEQYITNYYRNKFI